MESRRGKKSRGKLGRWDKRRVGREGIMKGDWVKGDSGEGGMALLRERVG